MENEATRQFLALIEQVHLKEVFLLIAGVVLLGYTVHILNQKAARLSERYPTKRLLILQIVSTINFFVYIAGAIVLVYGVLSPTRELLLALGGGAAVAIGFSLRDLMASLFAGVILLFDRPFQVGDRVTFADTYGEIKTIGLRAVRIRTLNDDLVTIPNSKFITDVVSSGNAGALDMMVAMDFHFPLNADIELIREILWETVHTSRFVYLKKPVVVAASEATVGSTVALKLTVKAYVLDVRYEKAFQTDVVTRATVAFREQGLPRPAAAFFPV